MIEDAINALADVFSPPFRRVLFKSLALTVALLALVGFGLDRLAVAYVANSNSWIATLISLAIGLGLVVALVWLAPSTTSLLASFFLDEIADLVEREIDPQGAPGRPAPVLPAAITSLRYAGLSALVAIAALVLIFVPGLGLVAWIAANAYVLGGVYFELAAMRFHSAAEAQELRRQFAAPVYFAGLILSAFVSVPILNLVTPLFATAYMVRFFKRLTRR
jgi:CysZ protein